MRHNTESAMHEGLGEEVSSVANISEIKSKDQLVEGDKQPGSELSGCVCVIKPNQPFNVVCKIIKVI